MLKLIEDKVLQNWRYYGACIGEAEEILEVIEKAGMLPPKKFNRYGMYENYQWDWDPEDETE